MAQTVEADYTSCRLEPGDILLLCSDGLYNMLPRSKYPRLSPTLAKYSTPPETTARQTVVPIPRRAN